MRDIVSTDYTNQYSSVTGSGYYSDTYAVCFSLKPFTIGIPPMADGSPSSVKGFYVNNGTYPYFTMKNGGGPAKKIRRSNR